MAGIPMVNLQQQYLRYRSEIDQAIQDYLHLAVFIGGKPVADFEHKLADYLGAGYVISCGNGTDALQLALMALELPKGSKIIVPAFTYIAPVEVIQLLGYEVVYADVDPNTFNITIDTIKQVFTKDIKAIIVVHLFGQSCEMEAIDAFARQNNLFLIEDNAQSIGVEKNVQRNSIITTSFFPSKNLGAFGDGGAVMTNHPELADKIRLIANHGQRRKYEHETIGINSRLDTIQAAVLNVKLKYLDEFIEKRRQAAGFYNEQLNNIPQLQIPVQSGVLAHTFHQYTIKVEASYRDDLKNYLAEKEISTAIYYPIPCYKQKAYLQENSLLPITESLCTAVLSLPVCPEISETQLSYICNSIKEFFRQ